MRWIILSLWFGVLPSFAAEYQVTVPVGRADTLSRPGFPEVPVIHFKWLIPFEQRIVDVEISPRYVSRAQRRADYPTRPFPRPLCQVKTDSPTIKRFTDNEVFPRSEHGEPTVVRKNGYHILYLPLFPVRYYPAQKRAEDISSFDLTIRTEDADIDPLFRGSEEDKEDVLRLIGSEESLDSYPTIQERANAEYLVIGPESHLKQEALLMFLAEKNSRGITTSFRTLEDINANVTGANVQEKVRNAIKQHYTNDGTRYVLLVGNGYSVLPTKYTSVGGESIGTDLYYACLDTFPNDMACEVAVGRAPATKPEDFLRVIVKSIQMSLLGKTDPVRRNKLVMGEELDSSTLGSKCVDQLLTGGKAGSVTTKGFPSHVNATKLYETHSKKFSATEVIDAINKGDFFTVSHLGHANQTYCMRFKTSDMSKFKNATPFFAFTQGCHPGDLAGPNWASAFILTSDSGAGAVIANSSFGWYSPGSSDGPSNRHQLLFYDSVFSEGIDQIGRANYRAKERLIPQISGDSTLKKVVFETNLFGDPELRIQFPASE